MDKRRELLICLLLIVVVIGCLAHTSWGQENDIVNIPNPSPAKSEFSREDILNQAQRSLDRSIDLFNTVATVIGVFGALITLIIILGGAFGYSEISRLKKLNEEAEECVKEIENNAKEAKKIVADAKPVFDRLKEIDKNREKTLDPFRERATHLPSLSEPFSEDQKKLLDEYGKKIEFLEAFGVPLEPEDYFNRGADFYLRGKYELALEAYNKAIKLKPAFADAENSRGVVLDKLGRYEDALEAYNKAIESKPAFAEGWYAKVGFNRGVALDKLGRYEDALNAYEGAIKLQSDYAEAWNNKGVALAKLGRYDDAIEAYKKAIALKSYYAMAWYNKACAYSRKGDKENALKILSKAIDLDAKYKEKAKSDEAFINYWNDEDFKRIVS
jgi:tetratricopeptide (TPR) repeat protein